MIGETQYQPPSKAKPWLKRLGIAVVVVVFAVLAILLLGRKADAPSEEPHNQQAAVEAENAPTPVAVHGRYLFSGTVVIARAVENEARRPDGSIDYDQPFSRFDTFNPGQYDAWQFDHECPMTTQDIPYRTQVENTIFNCRPEFIPSMLKVFPVTIANIANNHTHDMGDDGFRQTVELLEGGGIQTFGHYDPRVKEDICEVIALPVRLQLPGGGEEKGVLPVAFCAWHYFEKDPIDDEFAVLQQYAEIMPVFAFSQVGVEYRPTADDKQISVARSIIDAGPPEFVIVNSPHWVQNTEVYKGRLIVYSTGNFMFDQLDEETNRGLSIDATMEIPYDDHVAQWLAIGEQCRARGDSCLQLARERGLRKVDIKLTYQAIGSTTGYKKLTQKADSATQVAIEERANWQQTVKALGQEQ